MELSKSCQGVALCILSASLSISMLTFAFTGQSVVHPEVAIYANAAILPMSLFASVILLYRVCTEPNFCVLDAIIDGFILIFIPLLIVHLGVLLAMAAEVKLMPFEAGIGLTPWKLFLRAGYWLVIVCLILAMGLVLLQKVLNAAFGR